MLSYVHASCARARTTGHMGQAGHIYISLLFFGTYRAFAVPNAVPVAWDSRDSECKWPSASPVLCHLAMAGGEQ